LVRKKQYKNYKHNNQYQIFDFEFYSIYKLKVEFNEKLSWRIGKFISYLYRKSLIMFKEDDFPNVYISGNYLKGFLGKDYKNIVDRIIKIGLIKRYGNSRSRYDFNKKLNVFKLNGEYFTSKKSVIKIEDGVLNRWIERNNDKIKSKYKSKKDENGEDGVIDKYVRYEMDICKLSDVEIDDLEDVIIGRIREKFNELQNYRNYSWGKKTKVDKINKDFEDIKVWGRNYRIDLGNRYNNLKQNLDDLKKGNYETLTFKRDNFGKRLYNLYSRVIKEYRGFIKIEGEVCGEVDIKGSMISMFYYLIMELNNPNLNNEFIMDIKDQLVKNGNKSLGKGFLDKHKLIFEGEGVFSKDYREYNDFYGFMGSLFDDEDNRIEYKLFIWVLLFGDTIKYNKKWRFKGLTKSELEILIFGRDGSKLINDLKKIDLFKYIKKNSGREDKYYRGKNISLILHTLENNMMDRCRDKLMSNKVKYISMFDSFIVKKSEMNKVRKMLNNELSFTNSVIKFKGDVEVMKK
jgi:hypothetical protein